MRGEEVKNFIRILYGISVEAYEPSKTYVTGIFFLLGILYLFKAFNIE